MPIYFLVMIYCYFRVISCIEYIVSAD